MLSWQCNWTYQKDPKVWLRAGILFREPSSWGLKKKNLSSISDQNTFVVWPPPPRTIEPLGKGVVRKKFQSCLSLVLEIYYFFPPLLFKRTPYHSDVLLSDHLILFQLYLRYWKEELTPGIMLIPPPSPALLTLHTVRGTDQTACFLLLIPQLQQRPLERQPLPYLTS